MELQTNISWGYVSLLDIFFKANELDISCKMRKDGPTKEMVNLIYEEGSDTESAMTFLGIKHLGFKNMLDDYLIKCGIDPGFISHGRLAVKRDMKKLDQEWEEHRRQLGFR
ncbi:MAG TPA: hypothetical protein VIY47_02035, partial [Ignavibacteriaceae bacterium]